MTSCIFPYVECSLFLLLKRKKLNHDPYHLIQFLFLLKKLWLKFVLKSLSDLPLQRLTSGCCASPNQIGPWTRSNFRKTSSKFAGATLSRSTRKARSTSGLAGTLCRRAERAFPATQPRPPARQAWPTRRPTATARARSLTTVRASVSSCFSRSATIVRASPSGEGTTKTRSPKAPSCSSTRPTTKHFTKKKLTSPNICNKILDSHKRIFWVGDDWKLSLESPGEWKVFFFKNK